MTDTGDGFHLMKKISAAYEKRDVHKSNQHRNVRQWPDNPLQMILFKWSGGVPLGEPTSQQFLWRPTHPMRV